jgi:diguanylate cyclase (GGDEF)-like protein/PAS domain S-box-containing protein
MMERKVHDQARVLIVDDEATARLLTRATLEQAGFSVMEAEDGEQALTVFERTQPDLVLLDVEMPGTDGYTVCKTLRSWPRARHIPIIMVTGRDDVTSINQAYEAGATDFVSKPINWALLGHRVRYILRSGNAVSELAASEEKFRLITEKISDFIAVLDRDGRRVYTSPSYRAFFGGADLTGTDSFRDVHPQDRETIRRIFRETVDTGVGRPAQFRFLFEDGSVRFMESQGNVICDESGKVSKVVVIARDVSERKKQQDRIERLSRITAVLSGINSAIVRIRDRKEMLAEACRIAVDHGKFGLAWIGLLDRETMQIEPAAWSGRESDLLKRLRLGVREDVPDGQGLAGRTFRGKKPIICNDIATDAQLQVSKPALDKGFRSLVFLPLLTEGEPVGIFGLYSTDSGVFDDDEMKLLQELAGDVSFGLEANEKAQQLDYLAYYDALTGLPNRSLYQERLRRLTEAARPGSTKLAVVVIDVRGFHVVNDNLGRHIGDSVLRLVAQRLRENVRASDTLGRIGGDQFGLILTDVANETQIGPLLEKIFGGLAEPFPMNGEPIRLSVKGGVTVFPTATDGAGADALLTNAEAALKKAKASPETYLFYAPHINAAIANRLTLESKLRRALEDGQFVLHYQPKVESRTGRITGLEGLLRWQDPEKGPTSPYRIISLLEETGMILEVGKWVLRQAMTDFRKLQASGLPPPRIAVNVSAIQVRQKDFPGYVAAAVGDGAAGVSGIDIEITESVLMEDIERHIEALRKIRTMGIGVALDDFGTGYSSLSYMARLPADTLKIDQSFIAGVATSPEKRAIVSAVISLAHALNMKTVAEGVETEAQAELLKLFKCDEMQGYLYGKPMPIEQIEVLLANAEPVKAAFPGGGPVDAVAATDSIGRANESYAKE